MTATSARSRALNHPLFRPVAALILLLAVAAITVPGFLHLEVKDGHLYGNLIDILHRAAPLMLAALGMTLVIATRGIDVRAKEDLMDAVRALAHREGGNGMALLFISSELPEVLHCSDRVVVLRDRRAAGEYRRGELDERSVLEVIAAEPATAVA